MYHCSTSLVPSKRNVMYSVNLILFWNLFAIPLLSLRALGEQLHTGWTVRNSIPVVGVKDFLFAKTHSVHPRIRTQPPPMGTETFFPELNWPRRGIDQPPPWAQRLREGRSELTTFPPTQPVPSSHVTGRAIHLFFAFLNLLELCSILFQRDWPIPSWSELVSGFVVECFW